MFMILCNFKSSVDYLSIYITLSSNGPILFYILFFLRRVKKYPPDLNNLFKEYLVDENI